MLEESGFQSRWPPGGAMEAAEDGTNDRKKNAKIYKNNRFSYHKLFFFNYYQNNIIIV